MSGVYIHIPFCASFCTYCDFYSVLGRGKMEAYVAALLREMAAKRNFDPPTTIYFGGGTPSTLPRQLFEKMVAGLKDNGFLSDSVQEFTLEVNPDDITSQYASFLRSMGVSRVSMGVQSFDDANLRWMNRRHTGAQAEEAFNILRDNGFGNISLDLIFGYSPFGRRRMVETWREDVSKIIALHPEHISAYQMSLEPGSALAQMVERNPEQELIADPDLCAEQYSFLQQQLSSARYLQYEVSNFSLPGFRSRHNSAYWERKPYLGLGAAAHSFKGRVRSWNVSDIDRYIKMFSGNFTADLANAPEMDLSETLTDENVFDEIIMTGLRRIEGFSIDFLKAESHADSDSIRSLLSRAESLSRSGLLFLDHGTIRIPPDHLFISDFIIAEVVVGHPRKQSDPK